MKQEGLSYLQPGAGAGQETHGQDVDILSLLPPLDAVAVETSVCPTLLYSRPNFHAEKTTPLISSDPVLRSRNELL